MIILLSYNYNDDIVIIMIFSDGADNHTDKRN